jgi:4-hydroxy-4-methyl-2-oxoglutarate aldolase
MSKSSSIHEFRRPDKKLVSQVAAYSAATLHEAQGREGALDWRIKPIAAGMRFCGPVVTARCAPGDNLMLQVAISVAQDGDVLAIDAGGLHEQGPFGEVLTVACLAKGIRALVISSGVRDGVAIRSRGFPVFAMGLSIRGTVKESLGAVNVPIVLGGIEIRPGDILVGDDDGVVRVPPRNALEVVEAAARREEKEASMMRALEAGGDVLAVLGMDKVLVAKGFALNDKAGRGRSS